MVYTSASKFSSMFLSGDRDREERKGVPPLHHFHVIKSNMTVLLSSNLPALLAIRAGNYIFGALAIWVSDI